MLMLYLHILPDSDKRKKRKNVYVQCKRHTYITYMRRRKTHRQKFTKLNWWIQKKKRRKKKQNDKKKQRRNGYVLLLVLWMTLTSHSLSHFYWIQSSSFIYSKEVQDWILWLFDCPRSVTMSIYIWYTKTIISKCIYFLLRLLLLFLSNLITRAAASVYSHKTENGDTLHLIFHQLVVYMLISVCLIHKKKKEQI